MYICIHTHTHTHTYIHTYIHMSYMYITISYIHTHINVLDLGPFSSQISLPSLAPRFPPEVCMSVKRDLETDLLRSKRDLFTLAYLSHIPSLALPLLPLLLLLTPFPILVLAPLPPPSPRPRPLPLNRIFGILLGKNSEKSMPYHIYYIRSL